MVKKLYTEEQRKILLKNKNVAELGKGVIVYTKEFKIRAVRQYHEEYMKPREIFIRAGFDINMIGKKKPKDCLERWNKVYKEKGLEGLLKPDRKKNKPKRIKNKMERLEAENAYLKAENDFLAKLRAKKR